tara:strand:+ start:4228 stop:4422 length:195 start_codon:yes stop_codon:yes gene_type:complete
MLDNAFGIHDLKFLARQGCGQRNIQPIHGDPSVTAAMLLDKLANLSCPGAGDLIRSIRNHQLIR